MSTRNGRVTRLRPRSDVDEELMGAADAIADMAQRVQLNGPEPTYASEKLSHALYKAAEGLALCGAELHEVTEEARRGHGHGLWIREDGAMTSAALQERRHRAVRADAAARSTPSSSRGTSASSRSSRSTGASPTTASRRAR